MAPISVEKRVTKSRRLVEEAVEDDTISVGRTLIERRTGRYARLFADRYKYLTTCTGVQSCTATGVYNGLSKGARGILFPDNRDQRLAIKDRKNPKRGDMALLQEGGKTDFIEGVEDPVTDRFPKAGKIVKQWLSLCAELVLIGLT
jgi:hypothetical protein